jgi:hypothetical protein
MVSAAKPASAPRCRADFVTEFYPFAVDEKKTKVLRSSSVGVRVCTVSFQDRRGIRHSVDVEAESLYEAVVFAVRRFRGDIWAEQVAKGTLLDVEVREPATKYSISLQQVEGWLAGVTTNPSEAMKKAKLKMLLIQS